MALKTFQWKQMKNRVWGKLNALESESCIIHNIPCQYNLTWPASSGVLLVPFNESNSLAIVPKAIVSPLQSSWSFNHNEHLPCSDDLVSHHHCSDNHCHHQVRLECNHSLAECKLWPTVLTIIIIALIVIIIVIIIISIKISGSSKLFHWGWPPLHLLLPLLHILPTHPPPLHIQVQSVFSLSLPNC